MEGANRGLLDELDDLRLILRDIPSLRARASLLAHLAGSRLRRGSHGVIRVPFRAFEAEFELSQGEITPYSQMVREVKEGVIPSGLDISDWTVVDCGANVGLFSLFLKDAKRVIAVEPNPNTCRRLQANMERNGLNATVVQAAVFDEDGTVKMDFDTISVNSEIGETGVDVPSRGLDSLFAELGVETVEMLKLDVERFEIEALTGAADALAAGRVKRVFAEYVDEYALADLDEHLTQYGLRRVATGRFNARYEL